MRLCKWHTFWMVLYLICYIIVILFFSGRKWLFMRNLATYPWKTLYETQTVSLLKEIIQPPPPTLPHQIKPYYVFGTKIFLRRYTEINRHVLSKCFKNAALGLQEMVKCKCFFWQQTETCVLENLQSERFLAVLPEHMNFNVKWVQVRKMSETVL